MVGLYIEQFYAIIPIIYRCCCHPVQAVCREIVEFLRWWASNVTQPCNNWRHGLRFTALERPSRSCRGHPWCHVLFQGFS